MTEKEVLINVLSKAYNKTETELMELIYEGDAISENAVENILTLDAARVAKFKNEKQEMFKNGNNKGISETASKFEKLIKEKFAFNEDHEDFNDLIEKVWERVNENTKNSKPKDVKLTAEFIELEKQLKEQLKAKDEEMEAFKKGIEREKTINEIKSIAKVKLDDLKPYFHEATPENVKRNIYNTFLNELNTFEYVSDGNGGYILTKDGARYEDAHGNPINLDSFVKERSKDYFVFQKQEAKEGAGNKQTDSKDIQISDFKTEEDYIKLQHSAKTPEEKVKLFEAYKMKKEAGEIL